MAYNYANKDWYHENHVQIDRWDEKDRCENVIDDPHFCQNTEITHIKL